MSNPSEQGHWYTRKGVPAYTYIAESGKNKGKEMPTTLRQARKLNLVPSVTTVMNVAANHGLDWWKNNQLLMAALTLPKNKFETVDDFMIRVRKDADAHRDEAARVGSLIHADLERGFNHEKMGVYERAFYVVRDYLSEKFPNESWVSEDTFGSPFGFGGAIDLRNEANTIFVDFKTKDNIRPIEDKDAVPVSKFLIGDQGFKYGMQLSAYALGKGCIKPIRVSVFVDRQDVSYAAFYIWDEESHTRHVNGFLALLEYWQVSKDYVPDFSGVDHD
jgi:hypothetical protein